MKMQLTEVLPALGAIGAIAASTAAWVQSRRKPQLDGANVELIKSTVKESSDKYNARRDLELIRWQTWIFDRVRPWGRDAVIKFDQQGAQLQELATALGRTVEVIHLEPFPEVPAPLPPVE